MLFGNQTIETMDPKKLDFLQESHTGKAKRLKAGASQRWNFIFRKRFHTTPTKLSDRLAGQVGAWTMMEGRTTPGPGWLSYARLLPYLSLSLVSGLHDGFGGRSVPGRPCFLSQCGHSELPPPFSAFRCAFAYLAY